MEAASPAGAGRAARRWRRLAPLLLVLLGFGAGVLATQLLHSAHPLRSEAAGRRTDRERSGRSSRSEPRRSSEFRERLASRLALDAEQQAKLDSFLEANREEAKAFWEDTHARYRELRLRFHEQIREILTDSQRHTFDSWASRMERRRAPESGGKDADSRTRRRPEGASP